jgi:phosphonopyruvate decarboxylase
MRHNPKTILKEIRNLGFSFFTGVPDSLLKEFSTILMQESLPHEHIIAANEGNAIAIGVGHYLGSGRPAFVYMQNSGFGNAINPIMSLADPEVYSIPMMIMVGWRGEPGIKDEPQHLKQGRVMESLLESLEIPFFYLSQNHASRELSRATEVMNSTSGPVVILVSKDTFETVDTDDQELESSQLTREEAITTVVKSLSEDSFIVSTTGMASRELWETRKNLNSATNRDFLSVGSMGHASSIALGLNLAQPDKTLVCLDGDGAALMHMGSLAVVGINAKKRFLHVVLNNGAHDSVGGQPTVGQEIDFCGIARSCGYSVASTAGTIDEIQEKILSFTDDSRNHFLEIIVKKGSRKDLGRPTEDPVKNRDTFMTAFN